MTIAPIASQRIVRGAAATLEVFFTDQNGEPAAAPTTVTVGVTRGNGAVLVAPLTGTTTDSLTTGRYTVALAAANAQLLDLLTVTWTSGATVLTTLVEIVGGVYFTVAEARSRVSSLTDKYPTAQVLQARQDVEDEFERICGTAFVPRYRRVLVDASNDTGLVLPDRFVRTVRSVTLGTTVLTGNALTGIVPVDSSGLVSTADGTIFYSTRPWYRSVLVEYEYGFDRPPPEIKTAALTRLRERINFDNSGIPDRATSFTLGENGSAYRLDTAGQRKTGNPEIDAALARHMYWPLQIA